MMTILFWGPLGKRGQITIGGGESGNRRTIDMLSNLGIKVIEIAKPYPPKSKVFSPLLYGLLLFFSIIKFSYCCFKFKSLIDIVHVSAFYNHLVYFEILMLIAAKINHIPFVYEIRGGAMLNAYKNRSWFYRFIFDSILKKSDAIFYQGQEYFEFINKTARKTSVFYPNYVDAKHLDYEKDFCRERAEKAELIYFGRLSADKGIEAVIQTCGQLSSSRFEFRLHIIGDGPSDFKERLKLLSKTLGISDHVHFYSPMSFVELKKILLRMHFFLFPTRNPMEGHSNALTEAMAFGVVPICSDQGFNSAVVGPCGRVLATDAGPVLYAQVIQALWENEEWGELSKQCSKRIFSQFSSNVISPRIIKCYNKLKDNNTLIGV